MDNKAIEEIAVDAVKRLFARSEVVSTFVAANDKEPLWDGHLYVYGKGGRKNENLRGRIPVQVKGKVFKTLRPNFKFSVTLTALRNYRRDGGILYFVVQIVDTQEYVFYKELSPVVLARIIKQHNGKKSVSLTFSPVPDSTSQLENMIVEMYANFSRQKVVATQEPVRFDQLKDLNVTGFSFTTVPSDRNKSLVELATERPVYLYATFANGFPPMPMEGGPCQLTASKTIVEDIAIGGKCYYKNYRNTLSKDCVTIEVDDVLIINIPRYSVPKTIEAKLSYKTREEPLSAAINRLEFFIKMVTERVVSFGGKELHCGVERTTLGDTQELLDFYKRTKATLEALGTQEELMVGNLSDDDCNWLDYLNELINEANQLTVPDGLRGLRKIRIANLTLLLMFFKPDGAGRAVWSPLDKALGLEVKYKYPEGAIAESPFLALSTEDYVELSNLPYAQIVPSFTALRDVNRHVEANLNFMGLQLLEAADSMPADHPRRRRMLEEARTVFATLESDFDSGMQDFYFINRCQTMLRNDSAESMPAADRDRLNALLYSGTAPVQTRCAAAMLAANEAAFRELWCQLSDSERVVFPTLPIWKFRPDGL